MNFIGFEFTKISGFTNKNLKAININNIVSFESIEKEEIDALKGLNTLKVSFTYKLDYTESGKKKEDASVECKGSVLVSVSSDEEKEILKLSKKKEYSSPLFIPLFNFIMHKSAIKAIQIEDDLGLRPHIVFPKVTGVKQ